MAPATRQNVTSSAALMAMDRPGINYKTLTWGTRSTMAFSTRSYGQTDAGLRGDVAVRDEGVTLFGKTSFSDALHGKCYLGVYDGVQETTADDARVTARVQVNVFDSEPKYFNSSTYLGKKKTVGIGASWDAQPSVATDEELGDIDYSFYTLDVFAELALGPGSLTLEGAYEVLDLEDATALDSDGDESTDAYDATRSQGEGAYVQAGFFVDPWQVWGGYEQWDSDAEDRTGSYDAYRVGLSYYVKGHSANIKLGYERLLADVPISGTEEDTVDTVVLGVYLNY
jgi:hypothetical protein